MYSLGHKSKPRRQIDKGKIDTDPKQWGGVKFTYFKQGIYSLYVQILFNSHASAIFRNFDGLVLVKKHNWKFGERRQYWKLVSQLLVVLI